MDITMATTMVTTTAMLQVMQEEEVMHQIIFTRIGQTESKEQGEHPGHDLIMERHPDQAQGHPRNQTICSAIEMEMFIAETITAIGSNKEIRIIPPDQMLPSPVQTLQWIVNFKTVREATAITRHRAPDQHHIRRPQ